MAVPGSIEARRYYRCAEHRFEEAEMLLRNGYSTGAVYLAGYGVECMLKALILSSTPRSQEKALLDSFRGKAGHHYDLLKDLYLLRGGAPFPRDVNRAFSLVDGWSTDLRYSPRETERREADAFVDAARRIMGWIDGWL